MAISPKFLDKPLFFAAAWCVGRSELKQHDFDLLCNCGAPSKECCCFSSSSNDFSPMVPAATSGPWRVWWDSLLSALNPLSGQGSYKFCAPRIQRLLEQKPGFGSRINFFSQAEQENNHKTMFDFTGQLVNNLTAISSYGYISYYFICQLYLANCSFSLKVILGK